jgi:hypothetical protein
MEIKEAYTDKYTFNSQLSKIISLNMWTTVSHIAKLKTFYLLVPDMGNGAFPRGKETGA